MTGPSQSSNFSSYLRFPGQGSILVIPFFRVDFHRRVIFAPVRVHARKFYSSK